MTKLKRGTRIEFHANAWKLAETGRIVKYHNCDPHGWYVVTFDDGRCLSVHESAFRVIDNRA
jgi:hypothetical protein